MAEPRRPTDGGDAGGEGLDRSRGGWPPRFDEDRYKKRNTVERAVNEPKNSRAVATRYDKRGYVFLAPVTAAALVIRLRS